ncbi:hypothetical protein [Bacillus methanolicus]|uniref:Conserved putative membrane protein n=1 Tax=Bacillus methanolicus (strain MGA3 / ATCC 53907) TaxID=796606 RepID=I3DTH6_BACMM|nr:hypothetical protein [Bacillus methanolicus]AIE61727.1 Conserved putative membrane protein [Bacillus methanolicus MGA3]EIJ77547.1 hypothetical protein MGA3_17657 [Bacillus methanolicus MGA3]
MLEVILMSIERVSLAIIVGGGIIMAACVRPLLLQQLSRKDRTEIVKSTEAISINAWNRYNKVAFVATTVMMVLDFIRIGMRIQYSYWHLGLVAIILLLLLWKFIVDKSLKKRLLEKGDAAVNSSEQNKEHRLVELLSKIILVLAIILTVLPFQI